jgi:hypothetical protein
MNAEEAQIMALNALVFLASDDDRLLDFVAITGLALEDVRDSADNPVMLAGVMDYVLHNEPLLIAFAEDHSLAPDQVVLARNYLPGGSHDA